MEDTKTLSRGDQTRQALIHAALDVFGRSGFDAASTRAIAQAAGVNQALIGYHFGGKQGLYLGVFQHIVSQVQLRMTPVADGVSRSLEAAPAGAAERREQAVGLMLTIFDTYIDMIGEETPGGWLRLILREQQDPTEAFQLLYDNILERLLILLSRLVAIASGLEEGSGACRVRTLMLLGQVLIFFVARSTTARFLVLDTDSPDAVPAIKKELRLVLESQFSLGVARS